MIGVSNAEHRAPIVCIRIYILKMFRKSCMKYLILIKKKMFIFENIIPNNYGRHLEIKTLNEPTSNF